ncbi:MAG: hypothetical protein E7346_05730 [Clostridiales bacterium]|nr:hypothetical protein [Clostridiales bacterium]
MKKRLLVLMVALVLALSSVFVGCGNKEESEYSDRPTTVTFSYYYAGYGDEHYKAVAKDFMDNCNQDIYLKLVPYDDSTVMRSNIIAGTHEGDIIQLAVDMFRKQTILEEISDLYDVKVYGEDQTIAEKDIAVNGEENSRKKYFTENYKDENGDVKQGVFQFPSSNARGGYNFAYNATTLNEVFPDGYKLPVTTEEFFDFGDEMFKEGAYLTSAAIKDIGGGDYLEYLYPAWFAQLVGKEGYQNFYKGNYYNETDKKWVRDEDANDGLEFLTQNKEKIEDTYEIISTLLKADNDYIHRASSELNYLDNDKVFAGAGYRTMKEKTGFMFIGSWLETELEPLVEDGTVEKCEYGVMKVPVASAIVKKLSFVGDNEKYEGKMNDATLAAIIRAIDEGKDYAETKAAVSGIDALTEEDFNTIYEARKITMTSAYSNMVVPKMKDASKKDAIYTVLAYFASDRAQKVSAEATGGIEMMPLGSVEGELETEVSRFIKEGNALANDSIPVDFAHVDDLFNLHVNVKWYHIPSGRLSAFFYNNASNELKFADVENQLKSSWNKDMETYNKAMGELS